MQNVEPGPREIGFAFHPSTIFWSYGAGRAGTEIGQKVAFCKGLIKDRDKYIMIVNPIDKIRDKWRGRFKNRMTTNEYMDEIRGRVKGNQLKRIKASSGGF
ncbi:MAG: hypothetical protein V3S72_02115 [Desulfobacterales bacterium]